MADSDFRGFFDAAPKSTPAPAENSFKGFFDSAPKIEKKASPSIGSQVADVAASGARGLAKGAVALPGAPSSLSQLIDEGISYGLARGAEAFGLLPKGKTATDFAAAARALDLPRDPMRPADSGELVNVAGKVVPALNAKPETRAGQFAETIGEFIPGAAIGAAGVGQRLGNIAKYGVIPGAAVESVKPAAEAGYLPAWTPAAAGVGAAGLAGLTHGIAARPSVAERTIARASEGMTPTHLDAMEALMRDAQAAGLNLTRAEAAQAVTNGATRLADLQRVVEGQGGLRSFMADRPAQVEEYGRRVIGDIAETPTHPSMIGPKTQEAAQSVIGDTQAAINAQTRPLYEQVATKRGGPPVGNYLAKDPIYKSTLAEIRADPTLNRTIADLPDDNAAVIDLVQRRMRERAENARLPGQASTSNLAAANLEDARGAAIKAAENITGSRPEKGIVGSYEAARAEQSRLREEQLAPLMAGPIGKLSNKPETRAAIEALFPRNPDANSAGEVVDAVTALSAKNPWAARQIVRAHVESVFNNATRDLQSGVNQFGGASFKAQLAGNHQQAENLAAAIRGLPNGDAILPGFNRMLDIMEATGQRQRIGSQTAFNTEVQEALKTGRTLTEVGALAAGAGVKLPARIREAYQRWNLGNNTEEIARLLTDPEAASVFRNLANAPAGSVRASQAAGRLVYIAQNTPNKRKERASGGRVDNRDYPAKKASKLDKHARMAKDAISRELLPLMNVPDEIVASALRVCKH